METKFTFINGPTVKSVASKDDRSSVRSWFLRRAFQDRRMKAAGKAGIGRDKESDKTPSKRSRGQPAILNKPTAKKAESTAAREESHGEDTPTSAHSTFDGEWDVCGFDTQDASISSSKLLFWGNQRSDPFAQHYIPEMDVHHDELIDHCIRVLWPGFRRIDCYPAQFYRTWIHQSLQAPYLLNSLLFCASNHALTLNGSGLCPREEQLRFRGRALNSLGAVIAQGNCDMEALVMSILFLSLNDGLFFHGPIISSLSPFTPPLQSLQWLDSYAYREVHPLHWAAVDSLVSQLGGIRNLKSFALPWLLSFAALLKASKDFSQPSYPLLTPDGRPFIYDQCMAMIKVEMGLRASVASGFNYLSQLGLPAATWQVFVDLGHLSEAIRAYHCGCGPIVDVDRIADCRNLIQHRLLGQPRSRDECLLELNKDTVPGAPRIHDGSIYLFLACRSTALVYSTHVTFPIPCTEARRLETIADLQKWLQLASCCCAESDMPSLKILVWCTVVGGMAARDVFQRGWFAAEVARLALLVGIGGWMECKTILQTFCWMAQACDLGGEALWNEADLSRLVLS